MFNISNTILAPLLMPMDMLTASCSSISGFPPDQMMMILLVFIHIPLAAALRWIKGSRKRNLYVLIIGLYSQFSLYKDRKYRTLMIDYLTG